MSLQPRIDEELLTPRWYPLRPHPEQLRFINSPARFKVVPAGRRSGKTERAKRLLVGKAIEAAETSSHADPRFGAAAPTYGQAKAIFWNDLKAMVPSWLLAGRPSESDLLIKLVTGAEIQVLGMDKPQRMEGRPWDGFLLDEYANMKEQAWPENIRPALSDRKGWAIFTGVPEGRNHYHTLNQKAKADTTGEWASFTWKSADILDAAEIESARRDLDPLTFAQEYEASFINFEGRAYYQFEDAHQARLRHLYNPRAPIAVCFDFNVEPGVAAIIQEFELPTLAYARTINVQGTTLFASLPPRQLTGTAVIGEVYIERNSNTPAVCRKFIQDWGNHQGHIYVYGDATGGARGTAKVAGSDWDLVKTALYGHFGFERVHFRVDPSNPSERSRVNAVNTRLRTGDGAIHMMVDSQHAPHVVIDFEGVRLLKGGSGEIDKKHDPKLTHISDAVGYYVAKEFPVRKGNGLVIEGLPT